MIAVLAGAALTRARRCDSLGLHRRVESRVAGPRILQGFLVLFVLSACSDEDPSGDSGGPSVPTEGTARCEQERRGVESLAQVVPELGFRAVDVLTFSEKQHQTTLQWLPTQFVEYRPGSGSVPMLLSVSYAGGPIDFIDSMLRGVDGTLLDDDMECADALAIEVEVELETADGALRERFTAELRASRATAAQILHDVELDSLVGAFEITQIDGFGFADEGSAELWQPTFRLFFAELGAQGSFDALLVESNSEVATGGLIEFARWPAPEA